MYEYIKGFVTEIESNYIVLETNQVGYLIYTSNPFTYSINKEYKIYIYQNVKEDELTLYGFSSKEEKQLFLKLIEVKGVGCKMALPLFSLGNINGLIDAIERENILYLKKFPKIGDKVARQIILDLKGNLVSKEKTHEVNSELAEALKGLGYKNQDINKVLTSVNMNLTIEEQLKEALRLLIK